MAKPETVRLDVWTEHFLGTRKRGESLIDLVETMDDCLWIPQKWGHFEPVKTPYAGYSREPILAALTEQRGGRIANDINFVRKRPNAAIYITAWRGRVPGLNRVWLDLEAKAFEGRGGGERLKTIMLEVLKATNGVYATARHSRQHHYRMAIKTPQERLERMDWLTFFGQPYIDLFGGLARIQEAPCHAIESRPAGLVLLAAPEPDSPSMTESDEALVRLEEYLGSDVFAGRGYPEIPCRVPELNLSETVQAE